MRRCVLGKGHLMLFPILGPSSLLTVLA